MIRPIIHRMLTRGDLMLLVHEIARVDTAEGRDAEQAIQAGAVDSVLDSPAALEAVLGRGGVPAPLPLTLLWYIPVRAQLRARGITDVQLADYAATLPVWFATSRSLDVIAQGENGVAVWWRFVSALPPRTIAQAEAAADAAAVALWWAGCFPEWVAREGGGPGMIRAYVAFAGRMLALAAELLEGASPEEAALCARAAEQRAAVHAALAETREDYLGPDPHSSESRLNRFLKRLPDN